MKRNILVCMLLFVGGYNLSAQQMPADTTRTLNVFEAKADRFHQFNTGIKTVPTDSLTRLILGQQSLSLLLTLSSPVFIKAYGHGQLATTSFRGAGAEHTAVLWNGINLQNSMNGQTDFSLIPSGFMNEVSMQFGGNTSLYGSGAIGGAILLNNHSAYQKKLSANYELTLGSFGQQQQWLGITCGKANYYLKFKAFVSKATNNLKFRNTTLANQPIQTLNHAETKANGILAEVGFRINAKQTIDVRYWYQFADRNIPPTIGMDASSAQQMDEANRLGLEWKHITAKKQTIVRAAFLHEFLNYSDPSSAIYGKSNSNAIIAEVDHSRTLTKKLQLNAGVNYTRTAATNKSYIKDALRNSLAVFSSLNIRLLSNWLVSLNARQEFTDSKWLPFTAGFGTSLQLTKWLQLTAHVNKSYFNPTFNELYWVTGNPQLKPERGWEEELGITAGYARKKSGGTAKINGFNRNVNNWIIWQPNGGSWTPSNIKEVWSRGAEVDVKYHFTFKQVQVNWMSDCSYVLSTNQKANLPNDETVGKQLIYIPRLTHRHWLQLGYKKYYVAYQLAYTGYRFTSSDNSSFLDDYTLMNAFVGCAYQVKQLRLDVRLQCNNVGNIEYQVLPSRPMPLRNYLITIGITY